MGRNPCPPGRFLAFLIRLAAAMLCLHPAAAVSVPCSSQTGNSGCTECLPSSVAGAAARCYYCNYLTTPQWDSNGVLTKCTATSSSCAAAGPKDPNCVRCDGTTCLRCKPGFGVASTGKCANLTTLAVCRTFSQNDECAACNPDGTCLRCTNAVKVLLPVNAIYLDAGYPETQCNTTTGANAEAKNITGANAYLPSYCAELDAEFKCAACKPGYGPMLVSSTSTLIKCGAIKSGKYPSGCLTTLPYMNYCLACNAAGNKCLAGKCTGSRSIDSTGLCSLNCKGFFGISCKTCGSTMCSTLDPSYSRRRRR